MRNLEIRMHLTAMEEVFFRRGLVGGNIFRKRRWLIIFGLFGDSRTLFHFYLFFSSNKTGISGLVDSKSPKYTRRKSHSNIFLRNIITLISRQGGGLKNSKNKTPDFKNFFNFYIFIYFKARIIDITFTSYWCVLLNKKSQFSDFSFLYFFFFLELDTWYDTIKLSRNLTESQFKQCPANPM